jgi:catechol 2,3-dioxygenase-like lactoylglutathione lyase family enzyme
MRLQLALNVRDIEEAVAYYSKLFDTEPHKRREGYANFAIEQPPLKLVLFENPHAQERLNHLGVEVFNSSQIDSTSDRLTRADILDEVELDQTCCHAVQDKLWSHEPQGLRWEWYRITDDDPEEAPEAQSSQCCDNVQQKGTCCVRAEA